MLKSNKDKLVIQSAQGKIHSPTSRTPYRVNREGLGEVLPSVGGICYNVKVGDNCMDLIGDHVEPGVSIKNDIEIENNALMLLAGIGNEAKVMTGEAKGAKGYVTGMHGGIEHVIIHFDSEDMEKMAINDSILVKCHGLGFQFEDYEEIKFMNIDPNLIERMPLEEKEGCLYMPVVTEVPAHLMGSGIGSATAVSGDYDIMTGDAESYEKYGLGKLRFGDFVLLNDCDNTYGRQYLKGSVSIGVVVHSDCILSGHGPGIAVVASCKTDKLRGKIDENANVVNYMH